VFEPFADFDCFSGLVCPFGELCVVAIFLAILFILIIAAAIDYCSQT
jgi:hypothetical protein